MGWPSTAPLKTINLSSCRKDIDIGVHELAKHCPHLQSTNSGCDQVTDVGMARFDRRKQPAAASKLAKQELACE